MGSPRRPVGLRDRFERKVLRTNTCWLWTAGRQGDGYGTFCVNGKMKLAHRVSYELYVGPIPDGLVIDHSCSVRNCVRPDHLRATTQARNCQNLSGGNKGRSLPRNVYRVRGKFQVTVGFERALHYLGVYETVEDAERVATAARAEMFGEFAGLG